MKTAIIILGFVFFIIYTIWFAFSSISRCYDNYFGIYKLFSETRVDGEVWYYAKAVILYVFGLIPVYAKFTCNRADLDMRYWNNKEALLQELKRSSNAYSEVRKEKELKRTKGKRIL